MVAEILIFITSFTWPGAMLIIFLQAGYQGSRKKQIRAAALTMHRRTLWNQLKTEVILKFGTASALGNGVIFYLCDIVSDGSRKTEFMDRIYVFLLGAALSYVMTSFLIGLHGAEYERLSWEKWKNLLGMFLFFLVNAGLIYRSRLTKIIGGDGSISGLTDRLNPIGVQHKVFCRLGLLLVLTAVCMLVTWYAGKSFFRKNMER